MLRRISPNYTYEFFKRNTLWGKVEHEKKIIWNKNMLCMWMYNVLRANFLYMTSYFFWIEFQYGIKRKKKVWTAQEAMPFVSQYVYMSKMEKTHKLFTYSKQIQEIIHSQVNNFVVNSWKCHRLSCLHSSHINLLVLCKICRFVTKMSLYSISNCVSN